MSEKGHIHELVAIAHELKTPLTIIAHLASSLEDQSVDLEPFERQIAVERIRLSAERLLHLSQGIITNYRLVQSDQTTLALQFEPLNIVQICEEVAHEITPFANAHNQVIELCHSKPQLVIGSAVLIRSILFNLFDNAIKHNPPKTAITIISRRKADIVRIGVRDNGPGLSRADFKHLSQTIGQQTQPLQARSSSSGLGLYIAQQMAASMGGKIGVTASSLGASFHLDLLHSKQMSLL